jgi:hypothetical protein
MEKESIRKTVHNLAKIVAHTQDGQPLSRNEYHTLGRFFGKSRTEFSEIVQLYLNTILFFEKDESYRNNDSGLRYIYDFNQICGALIGQYKINPKYYHFDAQILDFINIVILRTVDFLLNTKIEEFSAQDYKEINGLMEKLVKSEEFLYYIKSFENVDERSTSDIEIISPRVKEALLCRFILSKRKAEKNDEFQKYGNKHIGIMECEQYFVRYAINALECGTIGTLWEDDIVNVILQLRNINDLCNDGYSKGYKKVLEDRITKFLQKNIPLEKYEEAKETLEHIKSEYTDRRLDDPEIKNEFLEAYQLVYMYELLTGKQKEDGAFSNDFNLFLVRQFYLLDGNSKDLNIYRIMPRIYQDFVVKEYKKSRKSSEPDKLIVINNPDSAFNNALGTSYGDYGIISSALSKLFAKEGMVLSVGAHEVDHQIKMDESRSKKFRDFGSYKVIKSKLLTLLNKSVAITNYRNLYHEISANLAEKAIIIRTLKQFTAGVSPDKIDEAIDRIVDQEMDFLNSSIGSMIKSQGKNNTWHQESDIKNYDRVVLEKQQKIKRNYKDSWSVLQLEYKEDGIPKSLNEIIQDQEEELASGVNNPDVGPTEIVERTKIRFQIMIERAIDSGKEEECLRLINNYIMEHQDLLKDDATLGQNYDQSTILLQLDSQIRQYLREGSEEGIQDAIFVHRLKNMVERINQKHKFSEDMFDCLFRKSINQKRPTKPLKTSPNNPPTTSEAPKTQLDDSTIQETN